MKELRRFIALVLFLAPGIAFGNVASVFGFGPLSMSTGATSFLVGQYDPFVVYAAPAAMGYISSVQVGIGLTGMSPKLKSFGTLTINSSGNQGDFNDAGVLGGGGQILSLAFPLGNKNKPLTIGGAFYLPLQSVARVSSSGVNYPFYPMYTDISRNAFYVFGLGYRVWRGLALGLNMRTSIKSFAKYELRSDNSINHSASAIEARTESRYSASAVYDTSYDGKENPWAAGLTYRAESTMDSKLSADISTFVPIQGTLTSTSLFSPAEWVLATSKKFSSTGVTVSADAAWVKWSHYTSPFGTGNINFYVIGDQRKEAGFKDVFVPRLGVQKEEVHSGFFKKIAYRLGYFYYPSPVPDQTGDSNFVDTNRHVITAGLGGSMRNPWASDDNNPIRLDTYVQCNLLADRKITKQASTNVGSPGYTAGGQIWVYGLAGTIVF